MSREMTIPLKNDLTAKSMRPAHPSGTLIITSTVYVNSDMTILVDPVIREQIEKAGARLARVLNEELR